jgi:hypothetical protein
MNTRKGTPPVCRRCKHRHFGFICQTYGNRWRVELEIQTRRIVGNAAVFDAIKRAQAMTAPWGVHLRLVKAVKSGR